VETLRRCDSEHPEAAVSRFTRDSDADATNGDAAARGAATSERQVGPRLKPGDFKDAYKRFKADEMGDYAAALTYYSLLSLFPALLFGVALLGFFGQESLVPKSVDYLREAGAPDATVNAVSTALENALSQRSAAFTALIIGAATALWGASGAFGAAGRALNVVWRVEEGRGFVRKKATDLASTLIVLVLVIITVVLIFLGGGLAADVLGLLGLGDTAAIAWRILRWPAAVAVAMLVYAIVYYAAPNVRVHKFQWITPGAVMGVLAWMVASGLFFLYVSNFSNYSATYGTFAGAVILLVWLWITNQVLLLGAELNAVIDLRRSPEIPESYDGPPLPAKVPAESNS
jgi:membrane protein